MAAQSQEETAKLREDSARRIKNLVKYIQDTETVILEVSAKQDIIMWLDWISATPDSTDLMRWYANFSTVYGFYLAYLQERVDLQNFAANKIASTARRVLETQTAGKVTEAQAKAAAYLDPAYETAIRELAALERLYNFLSFTKEGMDKDLIESYGHNQRLEMRHDAA